jgi:ferritin-like metal-binding protein YciE
MENAAIERLKKRHKEASSPEAKKRLKLHLEETKQQQKRLQEVIINLHGRPTKDKAGLPIPTYSRSLMKSMKNSMTREEWKLRRTEEDVILENAEIVCYNTLIQNVKIMNKDDSGTIISVLHQNLQEEEYMAQCLKEISPSMLTQLWPKIESSLIKSWLNIFPLPFLLKKLTFSFFIS